MERIDGKILAEKLKVEIKAEVAALRAMGIVPKLAVVAVGDDPASSVYAKGKEKDCMECGIENVMCALPTQTTQTELLAQIATLNKDVTVSGILVQLPLPPQIEEGAVLAAIAPQKDVDGFSPVNIGKMMIGEDCFLPCTPAGCIALLREAGVEMTGKQAVVVGRSNIVGKPMAMLLLHENATVTVCHSRTQNLQECTSRADILVAALGKDRFITREMVKPGAVVVDVGINRGADGKLHGDVDEAALAEIAGRITPVPGGVGVVTRVMLMKNTLLACKKQNGVK